MQKKKNLLSSKIEGNRKNLKLINFDTQIKIKF